MTPHASPTGTESAALRHRVARAKARPEEDVVSELIACLDLGDHQRRRIEREAVVLVEKVRARRGEQALLDTFLMEFGLSNEEGVALMCLAESLLRVPDGETADELIADKILSGDWAEHMGESDSLFVNASTWALMLTGEVIAFEKDVTASPAAWLKRLVGRLGEPVIRKAMVQAMRILGREFVLGRTIHEGIERGRKEFGEDALFSFDMLGEGARTAEAAETYFAAYERAIKAVGGMAGGADVISRSGVSVKLSALHPRYDFAHRKRVLSELGARLAALARRAARADIHMTIDAEEADRLDLSLELFEALAKDPALKGWDGLGLAVQAYGKRALPVLDWAEALAAETGHRFMVRLVKGAYWDSEIKHAQQIGLADFPVFTRKAATDVSYLACARKLLSCRDRLYPQFATHNAHTLAAVMDMARGEHGFEFQRLHGMGELLYKVARAHYPDLPPVRIYAPIGGHKDLLAYLVRRLLENGANSSFVNRFLDAQIAPRDVVRDPVDLLRRVSSIRHPRITLPKDLFGRERVNSQGVDLSNPAEVDDLYAAMEPTLKTCLSARPVVGGVECDGEARAVTNPADREDVVGDVVFAGEEDVARAFALARAAQQEWDRHGGEGRAAILERAADRLEHRRAHFIALLVREAGKTLADAVAEVREAADFCRYYAAEARRLFGGGHLLPGPTGEINRLSLHGRGVFVCISPWNFPLAIFMGQISAALAAGNSVVAKPAEQTPLIACEAVRLLHQAGVPPEVLHVLPGDGAVGQALVAHSATAGVAFTGGTETGLDINRTLAARPGPIAPLIAETGGQNVLIADSTALLEQLTDDVVQSAFYSAGQRCSALRVLYLQEDIAAAALDMICGAMDELHVGDPVHLSTDVGPIIDDAACRALERHVEEMNSEKAFLHKASLGPDTVHGTFMAPHLFEIESIRKLKREHFGPLLHVVRFPAADLMACIEDVRATGYGLTLGIHTRIEARAQEIFRRAPVGNTYVNRNMVGAVVGVQPFGGQGLSGTGPKAGGPHYLLRFATEKTWTENTMASGGNAALLRLTDENGG